MILRPLARAAVLAGGLLALSACAQRTSNANAPVAPASIRSTAATAATEAAATMARLDGYGGVRLGMDEARFEQAWGGPLTGSPSSDPGCHVRRPASVKLPAGVAFMFEHGHFVRYDVTQPGLAAPGGGRVGMDVAQIRQRYGSPVVAQPHKYVEGAQYLKYEAPRGDAMLVFETDAKGKVVRWRVGLPPQVDYVEGCG